MSKNARERFSLIIMVEKKIYDHDDTVHELGPMPGIYQVVPGEHKTLKEARQAMEQLALPSTMDDKVMIKQFGTKKDGVILTVIEEGLTFDYIHQMRNYLDTKEKELTHGKT